MEEKKTYREGEERLLEYIDRVSKMREGLRNAPPEEQNPVLEGFLELVEETDRKTLKCLNEGLPMVISWYGNANEIIHAMGIHTQGVVFDVQFHMYLTDPPMKDWYAMDALGLNDVCSLIQIGTYCQRAGLLVKPGAVIAMMEPCDAQPLLHDSFRMHGWDDIPYFYMDYPYGSEEEDWDYFTDEIKRLIAFLEKTFPGYMLDWDRLKEIVEETNKQYALWEELGQLMRTVPAPMPSAFTPGWPLTQHHAQGDPRATKVFQMMVAGAEQAVKEGRGAVPNEKIRILWGDLNPNWDKQICPWMAEKYGAVIVQSFEGYAKPYEPVDTSSHEAMLRGLAKRAINQVPMIRQARGTVDTLLEDIETIVRDYSCNCVFMPCHMGHKDVSGTRQFVKNLCDELGVPVLFMEVSLMDERYFPIDQLKRKISDFFEATGLADL